MAYVGKFQAGAVMDKKQFWVRYWYLNIPALDMELSWMYWLLACCCQMENIVQFWAWFGYLPETVLGLVFPRMPSNFSHSVMNGLILSWASCCEEKDSPTERRKTGRRMTEHRMTNRRKTLHQMTNTSTKY